MRWRVYARMAFAFGIIVGVDVAVRPGTQSVLAIVGGALVGVGAIFGWKDED